MHPSLDTLVFGGGGLLGRAVIAELTRRGQPSARAMIRWSDERVGTDISEAVSAAAGAGATRFWWCAGAGVTSTTSEMLEAELRSVQYFTDAVRREALSRRVEITVFLASSAGGVYGGSMNPPFSEDTKTAPLGAYGAAKLRAEEAVSSLAEDGVRVGIGRIANLYGPGQDLTKSQGLISRLFVAHETGQPLNVYVPLDTMRDYIYIEDAARACANFVDRVAESAPGRVVKIIASGRSVTVGTLISEVYRICRRRPPLVLASSPFGQQQGRDLRLRSRVWIDLDRVEARTLGAGMGAVRRDVEKQIQAGALAH